MDIVEIEWEDAVFALNAEDLATVVDSRTVGYLLSVCPAYYEIAMEYDAFGKPSGLERIPTGIVKKVTYLGRNS